MELEQLRQLDAIAREGTFSAAAQALHTSQPSISRSMRALERDLGCELFDRSKNHAALNDAGRLAVRHARAILAEERRMRDAFAELAGTQHTLRIVSIAPAPVWRLTASVVADAPGTIVTSNVISDEQDIERQLLDRTADLAITRRPLDLPTVTCAPFMTEHLSVYVPRDDELAGRASVRFADLAGRTFLLNAVTGFWGDVVKRAIPHARFIEQRDERVLGQLTRTSKLLGFVTEVSEPQRDPDEGRVRIPIEDTDAQATFYVAILADAHAAVRAIVTRIQRYAA